jgi:phosphate/sulfate permease
MALIFVVILMALIFEYVNGFHDTANSIAMVVATRVLTPRQAVVTAACTNLIGALCGTAVATIIASGIIDPRIATQEVLICALVMAAGTAGGGWRIIKSLGRKMVHLQPVNGFAAESSSAVIIGLASHFGIPVSRTHNVSAAIMGVGAAQRFSALKWTSVEKMAWAWLLTIPVRQLSPTGLCGCFRFLDTQNE